MLSWPRPILVLCLPAMLAMAGCVSTPKKASTPLVPPRMSPTSVVLEMFFVRFPFNDPEVNEQLWEEIDEQHFPPELRQRLARNGLRVGLVGGQVPIALSKLLELADKPAPDGKLETSNVADFQAEPRVVRRHLQIQAAQRSEIVASGVYDRLPLLTSESGELCGQTYPLAQGILAAKALPQADGLATLELVPELHFDQARQRWVGNQGMMRLETSRPKRVFDELGIRAALSPGSMLVLSSLPNRPGSLGHYFFTTDAGGLQQKLLVVRLSQTQCDAAFGPPEPLRLDE